MKFVTYFTAVAAAITLITMSPSAHAYSDSERTTARTVTGQTSFPNEDWANAEQMAQPQNEPERTVHRTVNGEVFFPNDWFALPEHDEFLPRHSNFDLQNSHPAAWDGQDWDISMWDKNWTPDIALQKFFQAEIFTGIYQHSDFTGIFYHHRITDKERNKPGVPVVVLGKTFYKLSDLDQRRTLKLLVDNNLVLKDAPVVELVDWYTKKIVGSYQQHGDEQEMLLN